MRANSRDDLLNMVKTLNVNARQGRRPSPHKPLLLLLSIGHHLNGQSGPATFREIEEELKGLIRRYGLPNSRENAHYPFWHLQSDLLWQIDRPELVGTTNSGDPHISDLREQEIRGGLVQDFIKALNTSPVFGWRAVQILLNDYFPPSLHEDILLDVGLLDKVEPIGLIDTKSRNNGRDRSFRDVVLQSYRNRCAICELDVQIDGRSIAIEAAHIKWHCASGPAQVKNGMALCALHHKFFDSGLFTVLSDLTVLVGGEAVGDSLEDSLNKYGGSILPVIPERNDERPAARFLLWHKREVFKAKTAC